MQHVEAELGVIYKMISLAFSYPRPERVAALRETAARAEILFRGELLAAVRRLAATLPPAGDAAALEALGAAHVATFDVGGGICPCETELFAGKMSVKTNRLADLTGFHAAFGFAGGATRGGEAPDHIAVSLEFLAFLSLKVERARCAGDAERLAVVVEARRDFLADHAGPFGLRFASGVEGAARHPLHAAAARLLSAALSFDARVLRVKLRPFAGAAASEPLPPDDGTCGFARPGGRDVAAAVAGCAR